MSAPRIRPYEPGDQGALEAFFTAAWRESRFGFDPTGAHADLRAIPAKYQSGRGGFWLLEDGAELLGTVALRELDPVTAEIKRLAVRPDRRGRGHGDRLLRHALDEATERRFQRVRLDTIRSPGPALHLFEKYGFLEIPRYHDNPDADVFMERALAAGGRRPGAATGAAYELVLLDLDGTLCDPIVGITRSLNYSLEAFGYPPVSARQVTELIGPPIDESFRHITGSSSAAEIAALVARYRERYAEVGFAESTPYPGVREALGELRRVSIRMAVCTSKRADFARRILERFDLHGFFEFVDGGDVGVQKWQQIAALRTGGVLPSRSILIGDRGIDILAAHRNGLAAGAVLWGYGSLEELSAEHPELLFESPPGLLVLGAA